MISDQELVGYLLMSLARVGEYYEWRFHLKGLKDGYARLREPPNGFESHSGSTLFLRGADSAYVQPQHEPAIARRFPNSVVETLQAAGHWLHVDQPERFNAAVVAFLT